VSEQWHCELVSGQRRRAAPTSAPGLAGACSQGGQLLPQVLRAPRPSESAPPCVEPSESPTAAPSPYPPVRRLFLPGHARRSQFGVTRPPQHPRARSRRPLRPFIGRLPSRGGADRAPAPPHAAPTSSPEPAAT
jgi:hypothetical protein